jgi:hypothetical protein
MSLKKCVKGMALRTIEFLPDVDESYEIAIETLDRNYYNNQSNVQAITRDLQNLPRMENKLNNMRDFYSRVNVIHQSIQALGIEEDQLGVSLFISHVAPKLSTPALREWTKMQRRMKDDTNPLGHRATILDLMNCIEEQMQVARQMAETGGNRENEHEKKKDQGKKTGTIAKSFNTRSQDQNQGSKNQPSNPKDKQKVTVKVCNFCDKKDSHWTEQCDKVKGKKAEEVLKLVVSKKLCKLCLRPGHKTIDCKNTFLCKNCKKRHHTILHLENLPVKSVRATSKPQEPSEPPSYNQATQPTPEPPAAIRAMILRLQTHQKPLMHIVKGFAYNKDKKVPINIMFDGGSEITILKESIAEELNLKGEETELKFKTLGGEYKEDGRKVSFQLGDLNEKWKSKPINATTMKFVTSDETLLPFDKNDFPHLKSLSISMELPRTEPVEIHLLLGEPYYSQIITGHIVRGTERQPVAWGSKLGYFLGGMVSLKRD